MKVININSGLGNQMFQYAFILNYKLKGSEVKLDVINTQKINYHNGFELKKIFNISEKNISKWERFKMLGPIFVYKATEFNFYRLLRKFIKVIILNKLKVVFSRYIQEDEMLQEFNFNPKYLEINKNKSSYFYGFFQSPKYFDSISNDLKNIFTFSLIPENDIKNFEILKEIKNSESVSIHVRRKDYLDTDLDVCGSDYYKRAVEIVREKLKEKDNLKFFIFSDDVIWCKDNLKFIEESEIIFIDWNVGVNSYKDMQLMSECKHNIIPNSSFSWWSAWLNKNHNKIIVVPKYWLKDVLNSEDRCPENWKRI